MKFNLEEFFFDTPIYTRVDIEDIEDPQFMSLFRSYFDDVNIEGYNPILKVQSTSVVSGC